MCCFVADTDNIKGDRELEMVMTYSSALPERQSAWLHFYVTVGQYCEGCLMISIQDSNHAGP